MGLGFLSSPVPLLASDPLAALGARLPRPGFGLALGSAGAAGAAPLPFTPVKKEPWDGADWAARLRFSARGSVLYWAGRFIFMGLFSLYQKLS